MAVEGDRTHYAFETVLGVRFLDAPVDDAIALLGRGGLMVVPSAPVLTMMVTDADCRRAVAASDFAIVDSAYLALLWRMLTRKRLHRVSGLQFIRAFLASGVGRARGELFLVNPTDEDRDANLRLLYSRGFDIGDADCYTAPMYQRGRIEDPVLVERIAARRPRYVMLNLGGGVQEPLGLYLRDQLPFTPGIICTGAAIAFETGRQALISPYADARGLGWLMRSLSDPRRYVPRYAASIRLANLVFQYGSQMPPLQS